MKLRRAFGLLAVLALALPAWAALSDGPAAPDGLAPGPLGVLDGIYQQISRPALGITPRLQELIEWSELRIFLEENATDGDLGIQFLLDGDEWKRVIIVSADWRRMVDIRVQGKARQIGLTEIQSESAGVEFETEE